MASGVAVLALALPSPAAAQSAGDEQYRDPLAGDRPSQSPQSGGGGGDNGGDQTGAPAPTPPPSPTPAPSGDAAGTSTDTPTAAAPAEGGTLPRTGADPAPLAAAGMLLTLAGLTLRRRIALRARA